MNFNMQTARQVWAGESLTLSILFDRVALVRIDVPNSKVNLLSQAVMNELSTVVGKLEQPGAFVGAIFYSGKADNFIAGADIKEILKAQSMPVTVAYQGCQDGKALLDRIRALRIPTVAAIHGRCLGGGLELALACRHRVVSDDKGTVLGLPEVALGVLPGWGGTVHSPRMIGFAAAIPLVINPFKPFSARKAWATGLVSEVVAQDAVMIRAHALALGYKSKSAKPSRTAAAIRWFGDSRVGVAVIGSLAALAVGVQTRFKLPAFGAAIKVMQAAMTGCPREALDLESRTFAELCHTKASAECVQKFLDHQKSKKAKSGAK